jgi:hypothetical protein
MLNWWDITASLLSREGPMFPSNYVNTIVTWRKEHPREWSNLSLNGCPDALLLAMYDIAAAAPRAHELSSEEVHRLESRVLALQVPDADEEVDVNTSCPATFPTEGAADMSSPGYYMSSNLYLSPAGYKPSPARNTPSNGLTNLIQCWRLGMILYVRQVFLRPEHSGAHANIISGNDEAAEDEEKRTQERRSLSENIMNLVSTMPMESNWQKQCLLPVVLAGFELRYPEGAAEVAATNANLFEPRSDSKYGDSNGTDDIKSTQTYNRRAWIREYCLRYVLLPFSTVISGICPLPQTPPTDIETNNVGKDES